MILAGTIATNPQTIEEVIQLEKALRVGSVKRRRRACLYLFRHSLDTPERTEKLFPRAIGSLLELKVRIAKKTQAFMESGKRRGPSPFLRNAPDINIGSQPIKTRTKPLVEIGDSYRKREKTRALIENIGDQLVDWIARHFPSRPTVACHKQGEPWVDVWKACRKTVLKNYKTKK